MKKSFLFTLLLLITVFNVNSQTWNLAGNNGIVPGVSIGQSSLGTNDDVDLVFKRNNVSSGIIGSGSTSIGVGSLAISTPLYNTAFGSNALHSIISTSPGSNSAFGTNALSAFKTQFGSAAGGNTAVGTSSLQNDIGGSANTAIGYRAMQNSISTGGLLNNVAVGGYSLNAIASLTGNIGEGNVAIGYASMSKLTNGTGNTCIGNEVLSNGFNTSYNTIIGQGAFKNTTTGFSNIGLGYNNAFNNITGSSNIVIGNNTMSNNINGSSNIVLGNNTGFSTDLNNMLVIGKLLSGTEIYNTTTGKIGIGLAYGTMPQNKLEINQGNAGFSGLRFTNLPNTNFNLTPLTLTNNKVLSVNANGDVILVNDNGGGITNSCLINYDVPVNNGTGNLSCSQIYDNGSSVSIGNPLVSGSPITYSFSSLPPFSGGTVGITGIVKLDVNGIIRTTGIFATSDKKFKKEIKTIDNALTTIKRIEGRTYQWDRDSNKEMNFDGGNHSGFIAQELEKILPHLVATTKEGEKSVNYIELIPYLVEAIKEQQIQIDDLKFQISDNIKFQNQDILNLENTKIINVSPNPSKDIVTVVLNIEKSAQNVKLIVFDLNGLVINSLNINERDDNVIKTFQKVNLGKGIFIINLSVNGKSIDNKKIIFN